MSVQMNQYAGFGYFVGYKSGIATLEDKYEEDKIEELFDAYHDSAYDQKIVEVNGFSMLVDGMNAKYIFFGKIEQKSECHEPLNVFISTPPSAKVKKALTEEFIKTFGTDFSMKPANIVFAHYR